jgi:hypothetical protein
MVTLQDIQNFLLQPLVTQWFVRFQAAQKSRERFDKVARICRHFMGNSPNAMWQDEFRSEFYPDLAQPTMRISLNRAADLVAIIGPGLFWRHPSRQVMVRSKPDQTVYAQALGVSNSTSLEQIQQQQQMEAALNQVRADLCQKVLEHIVEKHPGGVVRDIQMAIQDALVTGRGLLWTETFADPVTSQPRVGTFHDTVDNLFLDPDAKDPTLRDVRWCARRHVEPISVVERRFGYPPGYLADRGTSVSSEYRKLQESTAQQKVYEDQMEWYEVWSRCGLGVRTTGVRADLGQALDALSGDYCYLALSMNVPHPLNLPPPVVKEGTADMIRGCLLWRTSRFGAVSELWKDRRWPFEQIDFYPISNTVWPMAPFTPGLGALLAMNLLLVTMLELSWDRRRDIIAALEHVVGDVQAAIQSEQNPAFIKVNSAAGLPLDQVVQFIRRPEVQGDLLGWIQYLDNQFKLTTGLDDTAYGVSQRQARVTADISLRQQASQVRPEKMAQDVATAVRNIGKKELWLSAQYMAGPELAGLLGDWGAMCWEQLVRSMPFDRMIQEVDVSVEATDMARPDRDRDIAQLEKIAPFWLPVLQQYAGQTGNTDPLNGFMQLYASAMQIRNIEPLLIGPWQPPQPDPAVLQMQQQAAQLEAAKTQADIQKAEAAAQDLQARAIGRLVDTQYKQQGMAPAQAARLQWQQTEHMQRLQQADEAHLQQLIFEQERNDVRKQTPSIQKRTG